jgi:RNA polymerase sigma-70 factor (ECF subfamily)
MVSTAGWGSAGRLRVVARSGAAGRSSLIASRQTAQQLVQRLPPAYREAVVLRDIERLSYDEAARLLNRNVNTVKTHVARGRALLAGMLEGQERQ